MNRVRLVGPDRAGDVLAVILGAFGDRPPLDPPATATDETIESVAAALAEHGGLLAEVDGAPAAALCSSPRAAGWACAASACSPAPAGHGVAQQMVAAAEAETRARGLVGTRLVAREELPSTVRFWAPAGVRRGRARRVTQIELRRLLPVRPGPCPTPRPHARWAGGSPRSCAAGDLVILTGDLGAGKTTLTQGLGDGLGVRGDVTSPTFVIARVHPSLGDGPALVHVDAYRLGGVAELDDLDLDTALDDAVTVVEWGEGLAEALADDRLEVALHRDHTGESEERLATVTPVGSRWLDPGLPARLSGRLA